MYFRQYDQSRTPDKWRLEMMKFTGMFFDEAALAAQRIPEAQHLGVLV